MKMNIKLPSLNNSCHEEPQPRFKPLAVSSHINEDLKVIMRFEPQHFYITVKSRSVDWLKNTISYKFHNTEKTELKLASLISLLFYQINSSHSKNVILLPQF